MSNDNEKSKSSPPFSLIKQDLSQDPRFTRLPDWAKNDLHNFSVSLEERKKVEIDVPNDEWSRLLETPFIRICVDDIPFGTDIEGINEMLQTVHKSVTISNIETYTKKHRGRPILSAMADIEFLEDFEKEKKKDFLYNLFTFGIHVSGSRYQIFPAAFMKELTVFGIPKEIGEHELSNIITNEWKIRVEEIVYPKPDAGLHRQNPKSFLGHARLTFSDHESAAHAFDIIKQSTMNDQRVFCGWSKVKNLVPFPEHSQLEMLEKFQPQTDIIGALQQKNKELKKEVDRLKKPKTEEKIARNKDFFESSNYFRPKAIKILKREFDFKLKETIFEIMKKYRGNKKRTSMEIGITLKALEKHLEEMKTIPAFSEKGKEEKENKL